MDNLQEKLNNYVKSIEEKHRIEKILINILKFLSILVIGLIFGHYFNKCSKTEPIKVNTKNIRDSIADFSLKIEQKEFKKNSVVKEIKPLKNIAKKKATYFVPTIVNCTFDSTKYLNRIDSLLSLANKLDTVYQIDSTLIKLLKTQIKQYQKLDTNWQYRFDSLSYEFGKVKVTYFKLGFYTGNVTGFAGSLLIRK